MKPSIGKEKKGETQMQAKLKQILLPANIQDPLH